MRELAESPVAVEIPFRQPIFGTEVWEATWMPTGSFLYVSLITDYLTGTPSTYLGCCLSMNKSMLSGKLVLSNGLVSD